MKTIRAAVTHLHRHLRCLIAEETESLAAFYARYRCEEAFHENRKGGETPRHCAAIRSR